MKNIVLVGFMGTGKTSVGKVLSKRLKRPMVDIDQKIEKETGLKVAEIFEKNGEAYFRRLEKQAVRELSARSGLIITTGGGVVLDPENMQALKETGLVIGFLASPETIYERVKNATHRPLLKVPDVIGEITRLSEARKPLYLQAHHVFDTDGKKPAEMAEVLLKEFEGKW